MIREGDRVRFVDPDGGVWRHATCVRVWSQGDRPLINVAHNAGDDATGRPTLHTSVPHKSSVPGAGAFYWGYPE